jgi:transcriptional regulator with XRE-family HTH domain
MMDEQKKMLEVFKWAIKRIGFGQVKLANLLKCSQPNISKIKNGHHKVQYEYLIRLADAFDTDVNGLVRLYETDPFREAAPPPENVATIDRHRALLSLFKQKELALEINQTLVEIESMDPDELKAVARRHDGHWSDFHAKHLCRSRRVFLHRT